jgi:hypothetical protein
MGECPNPLEGSLPVECQCPLALISGSRYMIESATKNKPAIRNMIVIIFVFRARHSGVGGGLTLG